MERKKIYYDKEKLEDLKAKYPACSEQLQIDMDKLCKCYDEIPFHTYEKKKMIQKIKEVITFYNPNWEEEQKEREHEKNKIREAKKQSKKDEEESLIKKNEEIAMQARYAGFAFSEFNMFTNFLEIAKNFWKIQPFFYDSHRIWWLWNNLLFKWERIDDIDLINAIDQNTLTPKTDLGIKAEIIEALKRIGRLKKPKDPEKTWIQFQEEIYDTKTKSYFKASPEYFITNPIPWKIGSSEETPVLDNILKEWIYKQGIQDETYVRTLHEIMAYCMLSYMPIHRIFCLIGEGLNGKGSFLRLIRKLVGEENTCSTELELLSSLRFESNKLYKKLVCFVGEVDKGVFKKTKTLKSLTGEDMVRVEFKGKDGFEAQNYANPIIATNHLPETTDRTRGFYRRWTIVDFPNEFEEKKDIVMDIPDSEFENFCKKSIKIIEELIIKGEFTNDGTIQQREDKYERHSNYINEFIKLYCCQESESWVEFADFCEKYNEYLISEGMTKKSKVEIGRILVLKGFVKKVKKVMTGFGYDSNDTTKVCVFGIKWKENDSGLTV
jgi:P4 family phage/plasmid primase-like protien